MKDLEPGITATARVDTDILERIDDAAWEFERKTGKRPGGVVLGAQDYLELMADLSFSANPDRPTFKHFDEVLGVEVHVASVPRMMVLLIPENRDAIYFAEHDGLAKQHPEHKTEQ